MAVIAFVNQKGGCAKSTTAVHFAYWLTYVAQQTTQKIVLVDADAQGSSSLWLESLADKIPYEIAQTAEVLKATVPELTQRYKHIVVDGPAGLSEATQAIIAQADLAIVPCQPTGVDLRSAADAVRLIQQVQSVRNGAPKAAIFLSRAVKGTRLKEETIAQLEQIGVPILSTVIHQRQAIADTFGQEATIWELLGKAATEAAEEMEQLFQEILATAEAARL
ncbi:AAA family ATPase [Phormidium tenue FACHB-886]|nr:AAA family ATPase [Phormidium tenue FACHB-886]